MKCKRGDLVRIIKNNGSDRFNKCIGESFPVKDVEYADDKIFARYIIEIWGEDFLWSEEEVEKCGKLEEENIIKVEKVEGRFLLSKGKYVIGVVKDFKGGLSIYRQQYFNQGLDFKNSSPETIKNIGELLIEASKI